MTFDCGEVYHVPNTPPDKLKEFLKTTLLNLNGDNLVLGTDQNINFM